MPTLHVVNIKCGGCEAKIIASLNEKGLRNVVVDIPNQTVLFDGDVEVARGLLNAMGYPEAGTADAKKFLKKAKSYASCMIGRTQKR